jgi:hypothetical protein
MIALQILILGIPACLLVSAVAIAVADLVRSRKEGNYWNN